MEYSDNGSNDIVAVTDRLEALSSILGGIRVAMLTSEEKVEGLDEKLSALNEELKSFRSHGTEIEVLREQLSELQVALSSSPEQVEEGTCADVSTDDVSPRLEELNGLMDSIRMTLTIELGAVRTRLASLESAPAMDTSDDVAQLEVSLEKITEQEHALTTKVQYIEESLEQHRATLESVEAAQKQDELMLNPQDILPQLDELRSHQETLESQIHGIGAEKIAPWAQELQDRQGDHQVRLQQLESTREQTKLEVETLASSLSGVASRSEVDERFHRLKLEAQTFRENVEGRLSEHVKGESEVLVQKHADLETQFSALKASLIDVASGEDVQDRIHDLKLEIKAFREDIEEVLSQYAKGETEALFQQHADIESQLGSLSSRVKDQVEINLEAMESRLTDLELLQASEEERWSSLRSDLEAVSETVAKQDVISRAKDSELEALHVEQQEALSHLQREVGEHHDAIDVNEVDFRTFKSSTQDELEKLKTMIKDDGEAMRDVRLGLSRVEEELKQQVGEREAGLRQELALAKQSSQSEQAVVKEEITDLKKRQDQVVNLRQDLEESRGENAELRKSLRELNSNVYDLQAQSQSQKKMMFTGIAAVLLLSVGLSTLMMPDPSLATMSGIPTQALSQSTAEPVEPTQSEDWIALDAPALNAPEPVVEAPVVEPAVAQQEADFSLDVPEVAPAVTSSFALQRTNESSTSAQEAEKVEYTVQEGDSLWKIAKEHRGQGGMMERIERIKRDNALDVDSLKPGQVLSIYL